MKPTPTQERVLNYVTTTPGHSKCAIYSALGLSDRGKSRQETFNRLEAAKLIRVERENKRLSRVYPAKRK